MPARADHVRSAPPSPRTRRSRLSGGLSAASSSLDAVFRRDRRGRLQRFVCARSAREARRRRRWVPVAGSCSGTTWTNVTVSINAASSTRTGRPRSRPPSHRLQQDPPRWPLGPSLAGIVRPIGAGDWRARRSGLRERRAAPRDRRCSATPGGVSGRACLRGKAADHAGRATDAVRALAAEVSRVMHARAVDEAAERLHKLGHEALGI